MFYLNKIIGGLLDPMAVGLLLILLALIAGGYRRRKLALVFGLLSFVWLLAWTHPLLLPDWARQMEREYPPMAVEELPNADVIVLLGGGMSKGEDAETVYPELHEAADRVWQAARLYKAGKAPLIFTTGTNEAFASAVLLKELGVPASVIHIEPQARNTEENARLIAAYVTSHSSLLTPRSAKRLSVLLVTSAWHMRRAKLMFERAFAKAAPDVELTLIPAVADYEALNQKDELTINSFFPSAGCMKEREKLFKEILGYWGYRWLRK